MNYILKCNDCGNEYSGEGIKYLCPSCAENITADKPPRGVLKVVYDFNTLKKKSDNLFKYLKQNNFIDLLPIKSVESLPPLKVGNTPLYVYKSLAGENLGVNLYIKDDSVNATYSFKDRASAVVSAYAKENDIDTIVAASTGNAGSSLAGICASQQQKAIIMVPAAAPIAKLTQIVMYGAKIIPVKGTYDDAFDLSIAATEKFGWYNRNTAFNPLTVEGKKTVSFELFEQLGNTVPDYIFVPVGDGVIISGVYKGFEDLMNSGIIDKMPVIVAVQSDKSKNIAANLNRDEFISEKATTIADSISVDIPRNFYMAKDFLKKYSGETVIVSDDEIMNASYTLSKNTGIFAEPASAAAFAGFLKYKNENKFKENQNVVVISTGSGLKDLNSVQKIITIPSPVEPDIDNLKDILG